MPAFQLFPRSTCDARPVTIDGGLEVDDAEEPALISPSIRGRGGRGSSSCSARQTRLYFSADGIDAPEEFVKFTRAK